MPENRARYSPADMKRGHQHLVNLCNRLKMEEEIGSQKLTIFPSEKNEVCTKVEQIEAYTLYKLFHSFVAAKELIKSNKPFLLSNTSYLS
jgi:hypothetical protein